MNFRFPRNAAWRGWRSIFGGVIAGIVWLFPEQQKRDRSRLAWRGLGGGSGSRTGIDAQRVEGFSSSFCWLVGSLNIVSGWQVDVHPAGFLLVDSFLCLTKHHFWRLCWWFVLYEALYLWKDNQLLKKQKHLSWWFGELDPGKRWRVACGYLAVPKVIGSYGSCRAKVAAWLFGGGMRLGSQLYDPEFVVVVVCTSYPPWNQKKAPENGWLEDDRFLLGWLIFRIFLLSVSVV